jgi:NAD(P)H-dependent FMN reductase
MRRQIIAFGASSSKNSINKKLAYFAANQISDARVNLLDLNHFEMPIFSVDRELELGVPALAYEFKEQFKDVAGIIISFAEHNGAYSTAFKNIFDWISRIERDVWFNKPMFLLATSPGKHGGKTVLELAVNKFKRMNKNAVFSFSLPSFNDNFSKDAGITDKTLLQMFNKQLALFELSL